MDIDQIALFLWDNISGIGTLTIIGIGLLNLYYQIREKSPDIIVETLKPAPLSLHEKLGIRIVRFYITTNKWTIYEVRSAKSYDNWLTVPEKPARDEKGAVIAHPPPGIWRDRIQRALIPGNTVLLHPDAPEYPTLLFRVRLRSRPSTRRKVKVVST